ncbi:MAG TPA: sigma 54-interacting transcriptional regulator, partial [Symbiobacteriaceae bacterium]|nr:sigma 54-interacting transcriptional regulator [Symbiobacteriaceae bacterium]
MTMRRIDRVLEFVVQTSRRETAGVTADEVAAGLGIARSNASADLNVLWKQGQLVKLLERPVRYRPVSPVFAGPAATAPGAPARAPGAARPQSQSAAAPADADPFSALVGWKKSLAPVIKQAKAAILYPGGGLHTLICGPSGVGKSRLAELMHQFALKSGVLRQDSKLVVFNCADYAHNPQLLLAHLFGVVKGAYTGADRDQPGLVEQADGGILFLDEVHRLPPEGQEMLFRLIDKGVFRRLGESTAERKSRTLIVCATTERVDSALLGTFTRRIPMMINIPS